MDIFTDLNSHSNCPPPSSHNSCIDVMDVGEDFCSSRILVNVRKILSGK